MLYRIYAIRSNDEDAVMLYHDFREKRWSRQNYDRLKSIRGDVEKLKAGEAILTPKYVIHFKDVWHCADETIARELVKMIASCEDVTYIEYKHFYVKVQWRHQGKHYELPEQDIDPREKITG